VLTQVPQGHVGNRIVTEQLARRLRDEHLAAVPGRADASRTMDAEADIPLAADRRLAGMDAHAHQKRCSLRPRVLAEASLARNRSRHPVLRTPEGDEEGVPLCIDLVATVLGEALAQDPLMIRERHAVAVSS
jgi:hypothetical protein